VGNPKKNRSKAKSKRQETKGKETQAKRQENKEATKVSREASIILIDEACAPTHSCPDILTPIVKRGTIVDFKGSWGSGIAIICIKDNRGKVQEIPCENTTTVRALDSMFDGVITAGHSVNVEAIRGKKVKWVWDDMGLMLGGIIPIE